MDKKNLNSLLKDLRRKLDKESDDMAYVAKILSREEIKYLRSIVNRLGTTPDPDPEYYYEDIYIKAEAINSLVLFILNNPRLREVLSDREEAKNELLTRLNAMSYELHKIYFYHIKEIRGIREQICSVILAAINGILADKVSDVDIFVRKTIRGWSALSTHTTSVESLENRIYFVILRLLARIGSINEKVRLENEVSECEHLISALQHDEIAAEKIEISGGITIAGFANLLFVLKSVLKYLVSGETEGGDDVYSLIKTYLFNAVKLFENTRENLARISNLLIYGFERICDYSVWGVAKRAPGMIKTFLKSCAGAANGDIILSFLPSQQKYVSELMTAKRSIIISMPTSAGKTLLAELYILFTMQAFTEYDEQNVLRPTICYIAPTNALINQTKRRLEAEFKALHYRIESALPCYEMDNIEREILEKDHIDILVSTPEKLDFLVRRDHPSLERLRLVIVDEAHHLADRDRGAKLELLLAILKQKRKDVNFLLMSPFIKNGRQISRWLGETDADSTELSIEWTPTKQYVGCCVDNHNKKKTSVVYFPTPTNNIIEEQVKIDLGIYSRTLKEKLSLTKNDRFRAKALILLEKYFDIGNFIILCGSGEAAGKMARLCLDYFRDRLEKKTGPEIEKVIAYIQLESSEDDPLIECLRYGVAYHHARLFAPVKEQLEYLIARGDIKIVCATTTLAHGMNFPITSIIFTTLYLGGAKNQRKMESHEFWNIAGRAGRTFKDSEGHIITIPNKAQSDIKGYIKERTREILSSLGAFFREMDETVVFNHDLIVHQKGASEFLQYLNHILRVAYQYDLDNIDTTRLRNILNTSLVFREMEFQSGFLESQEKIRRFSHQYIRHMQESNKQTLRLADLNGISDISFGNFYAAVRSFIDGLKFQYEANYSDDMARASSIILDRQDSSALAPIIGMISRIPEIDLYITGEGRLQPEQIARIVIAWVEGKAIRKIAEEVKYENVGYEMFLEQCIHFINSRLTIFLPWGMSIYQQLTNDTGTVGADNLPSYIYYGVNSYDLVILSRLGLPRFAVRQVRDILKDNYPDLPINVDTMPSLREAILGLSKDEYNFPIDSTTVKTIIDSSL